MSDSENSNNDYCAICGDDNSTDSNPIVYCDGEDCDLGVHRACYNVTTTELKNEKWYCDRCSTNAKWNELTLVCCNERDGPLKKTEIEGFVHSLCARWNPLIDEFKCPIIVPDKKLFNACMFCKSRAGLLVQCQYQDECKKYMRIHSSYFHVTCAGSENLIEFDQDPKDFLVFCNVHKRVKRRFNKSEEKRVAKRTKIEPPRKPSVDLDMFRSFQQDTTNKFGELTLLQTKLQSTMETLMQSKFNFILEVMSACSKSNLPSSVLDQSTIRTLQGKNVELEKSKSILMQQNEKLKSEFMEMQNKLDSEKKENDQIRGIVLDIFKHLPLDCIPRDLNPTSLIAFLTFLQSSIQESPIQGELLKKVVTKVVAEYKK